MNQTDVDRLYDDAFYRKRELYRHEYRCFAYWLRDRYHPADVVELGSGAGYLLCWLAEKATVLGVEGSRAAFPYIPPTVPTLWFDLRHAPDLNPLIRPGWDLAVSIETVEHLPPENEAGFLETLACLSDTIFLTAGQTGGSPKHLNARPKPYWVSRMEALGFRLDAEATNDFTRDCRAGDCAWVVDNAMIFLRDE